jgi:hypothetical protein
VIHSNFLSSSHNSYLFLFRDLPMGRTTFRGEGEPNPWSHEEGEPRPIPEEVMVLSPSCDLI